MNGNQTPSRHRTRQDHLQPRKLFVFIANVVKEPQLPKHRIAQLGTVQHFAVVEEDHEPLRKRSHPRQDRVLWIVGKNLALIEVTFSRNRAEQLAHKLGGIAQSEPRQIDRQNAKSCLIE